MFSKIHHIGYAVNSIKDAKNLFLQIHSYKVESEEITDLERSINVQFLVSGDFRIELVESLNELSPINNILKSSLPTPYHICYEVESIDSCKEELKKLKFKQISHPKAAIAIQNRRVAFFVSKEVGLIELVEE